MGREASDKDQSREKRQVQNCQGSNCQQNNLGAGGFGTGPVQSCVGGNCGQNNFGTGVLVAPPAGGFGFGGFAPHFLSEVSEVVSLWLETIRTVLFQIVTR